MHNHSWNLSLSLLKGVGEQGGAGFPTGVANMEGGGLFKLLWGGGLKSKHGGSMGEHKMLSKNTCEGVHFIVKLPAIILPASKFTKNELLHTYISSILARF